MSDFGNFGNLFSKETLDKMRGVAAQSEATQPMSAEELDALNNDPGKLNEFQNAKRRSAGLSEKPYSDQYTSNAATAEDIDALHDPKVESIADKNAKQMARRDNIFKNVQISSDTPNVSSKLTATDMAAKATPVTELGALEKAALEQVAKGGSLDSVIEKMNGLSDEALSKMGSLGQKVMQSKIAKGLGKIAPPVAIAAEGIAGANNLSKGKYLDASGNALGAASGAATMMGSAAALPLAAASLGVAGGASMGRQQADTDVNEMGMVSPSKEELSGQSLQGNNPTDLLAVNAAKYADQFGGSTPAPIVPSVQQELETLKAKEDSSNTPDQKVAAKIASMRSGGSSVSPESIERKPADEGFTDNSVENLRKVQEEANRQKNMADLRNTAALAASAAAGEKYNTKPSDISEIVKMNEGQKKDADSLISQFQDRGEKEKSDPKSAASFQARSLAKAMLKQAGINIPIPDNVSANDLEKRFPQLQHMATAKESLELRKQMAEQSSQDRQLNREMMFDRNEKTQAARALQQGARQVQTAGGTRGNQIRARLDQSNNIFSTMGIDPNFTAKDVEAIDPKTLNSQNKLQIVEGAIELNKLLSGSGVPAQATLEKLVPKNIKMDATNVMDYMTSKLNPREQGQFIKDILKITARARDYAKAENTKLSQGAVASMALAKKHYGDEYKDFLEANNLLDTDAYLEQKKQTSQSAGQSPVSAGKITVSNGTQTFKIDPSDEADAAKDGFKRVQ